MANDEKELWARLRFAVEKQDLDAAKRATEDLSKGMDRTKKSAEETAEAVCQDP